ncbi:hypothetical protein [Streptomyces sp. NBC_01207]|uniref:hypothetical protein n=1 Tax=Streptomyces sp. NBC_01207 TaxID=2903772 RepID=UPI002E0EDF69|nr:hypothetical protein OG457_08110 [Streptomyces sp. NBC_01207]
MSAPEPAGAEQPAVPWTAALHACVDVARALAAVREAPVQLMDLLLAATCAGDPSSRARLVMRNTAAHHFLTGETRAAVAQVESDGPSRDAAVSFSHVATAALARLAFWTARTGDSSADTAHLLLVCIEGRAQDAQVTEFARTTGLTERAVVRGAMAERHRVCSGDRQFSERGPILSPQRPDRPAPYAFEARVRRPDRHTVRGITLRSQMTGVAHVSSRVQSHLIRLHMWVLLWDQLLVMSTVFAMTWSAAHVTLWSCLWLGSLTARRQYLSPGARLTVDFVCVAASVFLAVPWWLTVLALTTRVFELLDGRLALLQVSGDTGDAALTEKDLRADQRADRRAAKHYEVLSLTGRLSPE